MMIESEMARKIAPIFLKFVLYVVLVCFLWLITPFMIDEALRLFPVSQKSIDRNNWCETFASSTVDVLPVSCYRYYNVR